MFHIIIPARYASSRLPGKPLMTIAGRALIQWTWEAAKASQATSVVVATDDERIRSMVEGFGAECAMTGRHESGTDRIAEVARLRGLAGEEIVVNVQGDEPMMPPSVINDVAAALRKHPTADIATAVAAIENLQEFLDSNCVKAVCALNGRALYFSRAPIPWPRDSVADGRPLVFQGAWRHIGIYAYRVRSLLDLAARSSTPMEQTERLEQLRALEHGMSIHLVRVSDATIRGIDTPEELEKARLRFAELGNKAANSPSI